MKSSGPVVEPNGHGPAPPSPALLPASSGRSGRGPGPSTRPALIVLVVALGLFVAGAVAGGLATQNGPSSAPPSVRTAPGAVLQAAPARHPLRAITAGGQPPDDLIAALAVPKGSTPVAGSATDRGVGLYDRSLRFEVAASQQAVISFFRAQLPFERWHVISQGLVAGSADYRVIAQHPASDGHEWEIGATVSPTVFADTTSGGAPGGTTPFTVRLFVVSDQA